MIDFKKYLSRAYSNFFGWQTKRKIVAIESDDWGTIRMPSKETFTALLKKGIRVDKCPYNSFDCLESEADLNDLFEVLSSVKDSISNHPVITANSLVANPDFHKIRESDFQEYSFESVTETFTKYNSNSKVFRLIPEGMSNKLFFPQFHGREHLNVNRWMNALRNNFPETKFAFDYEVFGISKNITQEKRGSYLAAMDFDSAAESIEKNIILESGLKMFESIYKFKSESFIAPNYIWSDELLKTLLDNNIKFLKGANLQSQPNIANGIKKSIRHTIGERSKLGQIYLNRNCFFEPTLTPKTNTVDSCLKDISVAFSFNKPAIIISHRLNFIGGIEISNREKNLKLFTSLLSKIVKKWPDVEFLNTNELGKLIVEGK